MFKRIVGCAVVTLLLIAAVAAAGSAPHLQTIVQKGKITIGLNVDYPPFCLWHDGSPRGFDVELSRAIVAKMGLDPQKDITFVPVKAAEAVAALTSGKVDLVVAGLTVTSERAKRIAFTRPYYTATIAGLLARSKVPQIQHENLVRPMPMASVKDLKKIEPLVVAVKEKTTIEHKVRLILRNSKVVAYPNMRAATQAVIDGRADVLVHEDPYLRHMAAGKFAGAGRFKPLTAPATTERLAIACRQGDPHFVSWLNIALDELADAGLLKAWEKEYFDSAAWRQEVPWK